MTDLTIKYASPDDLETIAPLFDAYRVFYQQPSNTEAARQFIKKRLELQDSVILIARHSRSPEAVGFVQLYPSYCSVEMQHIWILSDLYVIEEARRCGVARALMERSRLHARFTGATQLALQTAVTNERAQRLYESLGYVKDVEFLTYILSVS